MICRATFFYLLLYRSVSSPAETATQIRNQKSDITKSAINQSLIPSIPALCPAYMVLRSALIFVPVF